MDQLDTPTPGGDRDDAVGTIPKAPGEPLKAASEAVQSAVAAAAVGTIQKPPAEATPKSVAETAGTLGEHPHVESPCSAFSDSVPDLEINRAVGQFQDSLGEKWRLKFRSGNEADLGKLICELRTWGADLWAKFLPREWKGILVAQPPLHFVFEVENRNTLGHYRADRNSAGILFEISINPLHLNRRSKADIAATVLHEELHCFEHLVGTAPTSKNGYHSSWFRAVSNELGIPCSMFGHEQGILDPSPFLDWARKQQLSGAPAVFLSAAPASEAQPRPKRITWICGCPSDARVGVLVPAGSELAARCTRCGTDFHPRS